MSNKPDGGPAFPNRGDNSPDCSTYDGMTLRDYFKGQSLAGLRANPEWHLATSQHVAEQAEMDADAMLAEREV